MGSLCLGNNHGLKSGNPIDRLLELTRRGNDDECRTDIEFTTRISYQGAESLLCGFKVCCCESNHRQRFTQAHWIRDDAATERGWLLRFDSARHVVEKPSEWSESVPNAIW